MKIFNSVLLAVSLIAGFTSAQWQINGTRYSTNGFTSGAAGPFDLGIVYPLHMAHNTPNPNQAVLGCWGNYPYARHGYYVYTGWGLPINVVFYGNGFSNDDKNTLTTLLGGIGGHSYWRAIRNSNYFGYEPASPSLGQVVHTGAIWSGDYNIGGTDLRMFQEQNIINNLIDRGLLVKQAWSVYTIILGSDIKYTSNQGLVHGASTFCGMHSVVSWGSAWGSSYSCVAMLKSYESTCNIAKALGGAFPNNWNVDNVAGILIHELAESILSPPQYSDRSPAWDGRSAWKGDNCGYEPADICGNQYLNVNRYGSNANIHVSGRNYILFPMWDPQWWNCVMGD